MDSQQDARVALEQYKLVNARETGKEFGAGSYASVVEVEYKGLKCAGKKIHRVLYVNQVDNHIRSFEAECRLLSQLRHPNIVQFLGIYFEPDTNAPVLVMEWLPTSLSQCLDRYGVLPDEVSYSILEGVALGLRYLHEHPNLIIHRDLSANNVLLTSDMTAKLADLGVAKILRMTPNQMSRMTQAPGTQSYMPPEALVPNPRYSIKVDVFSFGVMIVHVLSGKWPLPGESVQVDPRNPRNLIPMSEFDRRMEFIKNIDVAHPLMPLIKGCLNNSPDLRPTTSELHRQVSRVSMDHPPAFSNIVEMLGKIKSLGEEKVSLTTKRDSLKREKKELAVKNDSLQHDMKLLAAERDSLQHDKKDLTSKWDTLQHEKEALSAQLQDIQVSAQHDLKRQTSSATKQPLHKQHSWQAGRVLPSASAADHYQLEGHQPCPEYSQQQQANGQGNLSFHEVPSSNKNRQKDLQPPQHNPRQLSAGTEQPLRKQHSWQSGQPPPGDASNYSPGTRRHLYGLGKSSSLAQGEGAADPYQREGHHPRPRYQQQLQHQQQAYVHDDPRYQQDPHMFDNYGQMFQEIQVSAQHDLKRQTSSATKQPLRKQHSWKPGRALPSASAADHYQLEGHQPRQGYSQQQQANGQGNPNFHKDPASSNKNPKEEMAHQITTRAILLQDFQVENTGVFVKMGLVSKVKNIYRGELVSQLAVTDDGRTPNYCLVSNPSLTLHCRAQDVAPLLEQEFHLLEGIQSREDRFAVFIKDSILEWGMQIQVGGYVYVTLPGRTVIPKERVFAVVRYIGPVNLDTGIQFGVEIVENGFRRCGTTDGFFGGKYYFHCEEDCGLFVGLDKLSPDPDKGYSHPKPDNHKPAQTSVSAQQSMAQSSSHATTQSQAKKKSQEIHFADPPPSQFKLGDRVVIHNKVRQPVHGTVRWMGKVRTEHVTTNAIGIETDTHVDTKDFTGSLKGWSRQFKTNDSHHGKIVMLEYMVQEAAKVQPRIESSADLPPSSAEEKLAKHFGESISQQHEAIQRANKARELEYLRKAVPTRQPPQYNPRQLSAGTELPLRKQHSQPPPGDASNYSPGTRRHLYGLGKSSSLARGEGAADHYQREGHHLREFEEKNAQKKDGNSQQPSSVPHAQDRSQHPGSSSRQRNVQHIYDTLPDPNQQNGQKDLPRPGHQQQLQHQQQQAYVHENARYQQDPRMFDNYGQQNQQDQQMFQGQYQPDPRLQQHDNRFDQHQAQYGQPRASPQQKRGVAASTAPLGSTPLSVAAGLAVGSAIQIPSSDPTQPHQYGVIRWIGDIPYVQGGVAGIELEEHMEGCTDVTWQPTGKKFFDCPSGRGIYYPLQNLKPDERFLDHGGISGSVRGYNSHGSAVPLALTLDVGSTIQIEPYNPSQPRRYGVIKWIGDMPGVQGKVAGIELEEYMERCCDGSSPQTGEKLFDCPLGKGMFCPLLQLRPDERFLDLSSASGSAGRENPLSDVLLSENVDQTIGTDQFMKYIGEGRGIQGHQNSCYLDATVFGLFALSDVFDTMFLEDHLKITDLNRKAIGDLLWKGIVNPLRKNGVVRYESVMKLRNKLDELGKEEGIAQDEKDPEEFLNMLFKHFLRVEPFISIRRPFGTEQEFFVQLFLEFDESLRLPSVGDLLRKMFREQNISFTDIPSKLLIQVPRLNLGSEFKTYQKIVPDLKLRIMDLTDSCCNAQVPNCFVCDEKCTTKCVECRNFFNSPESDAVYFCYGCDKLVHTSHDKHMHFRDAAITVSELELLSVICIETSHYVCFTKEPQDDPDQPLRWIFFDSMANRVHDTYNIPKVEECSALLNEWVYPSNNDRTRLMSTPPKQLPEYVRRFTQDVYMCVYVEPDASMYG